MCQESLSGNRKNDKKFKLIKKSWKSQTTNHTKCCSSTYNRGKLIYSGIKRLLNYLNYQRSKICDLCIKFFYRQPWDISRLLTKRKYTNNIYTKFYNIILLQLTEFSWLCSIISMLPDVLPDVLLIEVPLVLDTSYLPRLNRPYKEL